MKAPHVHHWRIDAEPDDEGVFAGRCGDCKTRRTFRPFDSMESLWSNSGNTILYQKGGGERIPGENVVAVKRGHFTLHTKRPPRACCGSIGTRHKRDCAVGA